MAFEGGFALDADARTLRAAMTVPPPPGRLWQINQTIRQLKQHGIWQKLDVLWMLAAHDAQAARLNWKAPGSFALTAVNSPTFTADRGYAGNGSSSYLNTNWSLSANSVNYTQNNASVFAWNRTVRAASSSPLVGVFTTSPSFDVTIYPRFSGDQVYHRVNDSPVTSFFTNTNSSGFYHGDRQSSTARTAYRNAVSVGAYASAPSGTLPNLNLFIGCANYNNTPTGFGTDQIACVGAGASLNNQKDALYSILQTYMTRIGA